MNLRGLFFCALFLFLASVFLSGCASQTSAENDALIDEWKARAETSLPIVQPPSRNTTLVDDGQQVSDVSISSSPIIPVKSSKISRDELPDTRISINFVDTNLGTVLRALGRMAGQNIIISPSVKGSVNTHIVDTPWNDVFLGIVNSYGLFLSKEENLLRVMSVEDLKLQVERESVLLEQGQVSQLVNRIVPVEFSNPADVAESIKLLLSKDKDGNPRGSVSVDTHSRSLVLRDAEDNISMLLSHIAQLDRPTPQILIEAHIIETNKDTARELGVQWGWLMIDQISSDRFWGIHPGGISGTKNVDTGALEYIPGVDGTNRSGIGGQGFGIDLPAAAIGSVNPASLGLMHFTTKGNILDMQLSALQKAGKVNILSRPSIATLDNIEANIESCTEVPYQTIDENGNIKVEYKDAVLRLTVTPHVISDRLIKLDLLAKKDEVDLTRTVLGNPFIIKKLAQTKLIVQNGTTVVIAGLSKERRTDGSMGVPFLKDLPLLGWLFRSESLSSEFEELLVFITPKILTSGEEVATLDDTGSDESEGRK
jgi:type IV pilus assembly protein PilQ